ncbi:hypothetical protein GCM10007416_11450 [Kroppenstedtia guangzhouensis]|uniref:Uncharacterized protein n=1 Tax=Kroppenstedtia guangzhouensis TaxID=1274356 RepID=A0ABQ1GB20_9BACL|nr:hypothetical protein [Kroppenstedtia guangzhouensis]GGA40186.1 hypothetical protein GCM10007416_11450 [Kroppenstedtia guangzhouensis]
MESRELERYRGVFTKVPGDPSRWRRWERMGHRWVLDYLRRQGGLPISLVCRGGEKVFPRYFQLLAPGGRLTFRGSLEGVHYTFLGKRGNLSPRQAFEKAEMRRGETVLIYYGSDWNSKVDPVGMEAIESALDLGGIPVVAVATEEQGHFVKKRWVGQLAGVFSLEEMAGEVKSFDWPSSMPVLPDPASQFRECREALALYQERTVHPFRNWALTRLGREVLPETGFDLVFERSGQDTLGISIHLIRPGTGRVVYGEEMAGRRYSFYAPQLWMNQRQIIMPSAIIMGKAPVPEGELSTDVEQLARRLEPVGIR